MIKADKILYRNSKIPILFSITLLTITALAYEVLITRLFSAIFMHHFVFMVTSVAVLGLGLGAIFAYNIDKKFTFTNNIIVKQMFFLPILIATVILLMYKSPYVGIGLLYSIVSGVPFVVIGSILSLLFKNYSSISNTLYFSDLVGSAIGSVFIILLMNKYGFMITLVYILILATLPSIIMGFVYRLKKISIANGLVFLLLIVVLNNPGILKDIEKEFTSYFASPYTILNYLQEKGTKIRGIPYTKWDAISRTEVVETNDNKRKFILTDGGGTTTMVKFNGNLDEVKYLTKTVDYIPFAFGRNDKTLVIGSGGGKDVLLAKLGGAQKVDAVEINTSTLDAVKEFSDFNGGIYSLEGVNVYNQDGRYFIEKTEEKYDHIYLSMIMTNAVENTAFSLSENYIFTYEAFKNYFDKLEKDGKLSFMPHDSMDMLRILFTGIKMLQDKGIPKDKVTNHFVIINKTKTDIKNKINYQPYINMPIVIFKLKPFDHEEIKEIERIVEGQNRQVIHIPGSVELKVFNDYRKGDQSLEQLMDKYIINVKPITDNKPFFYNFDRGIPGIMVRILLIVSAIVFLVIKKYYKDNDVRKNSLFFAYIAVAFMMIEIPLIQKMSLFVGTPSIAFSFILFVLLLSAGLGSLYSKNKIFCGLVKHRYIPLLLTGILALLMPLQIEFIYNNFFGLKQIYRMVILAFIIIPLGFFMGMAFPYGLKIIRDKGYESHIPLVWGINGLMSVFGSVLAVTSSMILGFNVTLALGGLVYIVLFFINPLSKIT